MVHCLFIARGYSTDITLPTVAMRNRKKESAVKDGSYNHKKVQGKEKHNYLIKPFPRVLPLSIVRARFQTSDVSTIRSTT